MNLHDDVTAWKRFPVTDGFPPQKEMLSFVVFFVANKLLQKNNVGDLERLDTHWTSQ